MAAARGELMARGRSHARRYRLHRRGRLALVLSVLGGVLAFGVYYLSGHGALGSSAGRAARPADWPLTLVNEAHPLPEGFTADVEEIENRVSFDRQAADSLRRMLSDARAQGLRPLVCSGYRSVTRQQQLYDEQVGVERDAGHDEVQAMAVAKTKVALPGTSEHNLGLAADIVAVDYQELKADFENTPECQWLMSHAAEYGFILRYPKDKTEITGIQYEPWHYRYVGRDAAQEIAGRGVCLEEYLKNK